LTLITLGGCLAMVYTTGVSSPGTTAFYRKLGATDFHFGLLGGVPLMLLILQYVGAALNNRLRRRKPIFMFSLIVSRLVLVPISLLPLAWPGLSPYAAMVWVLGLTALSGALVNMGSPLWFSWMADLIPSEVLNRYWGNRQRWMHAVWTVSFLAVAAYWWLLADTRIEVAFPILVAITTIAGVVDILLFRRVDEPPNVVTPDRSFLDALMEPLRHRDYRRFVVFGVVFAAGTMFAAAFMQLYVLDVLKTPVWQATLIWSVIGLGVALSAPIWGRLADRHGQKPVLFICVACKPLVALVFLFLTPANVVWVLTPVFFVDSMWNAGVALAQNGVMMKLAPRENRSMFIAAVVGLNGIAGGLAAIAAGAYLRLYEDFSAHAFGRTWNNYHLLFVTSFFMRIGCIPLVHWVREPKSARPMHVLEDMFGVWPLRVLRFPVGFYRRAFRHERVE
jgi:MFS family permease